MMAIAESLVDLHKTLSTAFIILHHTISKELLKRKISQYSQLRNKRPPLTWKLLGHFFLLGLTGVSVAQACFLEGLTYTSPTFASAVQNSIPAITFIIAVAFGQERVHVKRLDGLAKIMGTLLCVIGAATMAFYKGPTLVKGDENDGSDANDSSAIVASILDWAFGLTSVPVAENASELLHGSKTWQIGAFFHMGMSIAFSFWLVIQVFHGFYTAEYLFTNLEFESLQTLNTW
ncbi:hypothetical protein KP509_21G077500 [Ceratopteris richardii]|uniref:WAT1-related protein n=1 Tax=Ceratopteris richardii TaxID=49495 RepID=A0A8T2SDN2_CERRI|nr:hypothetical protein KP509_21G077500 [Ceratopteris richardii]